MLSYSPRIWDQKGPEDSPLRFLVTVSDRVIFRDEYKRSTELECQRNSVRKPDEAKLQALQNDVMMGLDVDDEINEVATNMVRTGSGVGSDGVFNNSFAGAHIADLRGLLGPADTDKQADHKDPPIKKEQSDQLKIELDVGLEESAAEWFDRETEINKAKRVWNTSVASLSNDYDKGRADAKVILHDLSKHQSNAHFRNAYPVCQNRLVAAELMINGTLKDLTEWFDKVVLSTQEGSRKPLYVFLLLHAMLWRNARKPFFL